LYLRNPVLSQDKAIHKFSTKISMINLLHRCT
jgi:hypothetical protein